MTFHGETTTAVLSVGAAPGVLGVKGRNGQPTIYGTPLQMAELLASVTKLITAEPDSTWEDPTARLAARELAGQLHERLAATVGQ